MLGFIVGFIIGGFFGFTMAAIIVVSHDSEEREKRIFDGKDGYTKGDEMR